MLSPAHAARQARFVRLSRWWQSWRLALRLARRDVWAHRGRSLLIVIMVAAPVLLVGTLATWFTTTDISVRESLPVRLGNAQAEIRVDDGGRWAVEQLANGRDYFSSEEAARPFGSHQPGTDWTADQLSALTGGRVVEAHYPLMFRSTDDRVTRLTGLALPAAELPTSGLATLVSGRWPAAPDEVAVTKAGVERGLPTTGSIAVRGADGGHRANCTSGGCGVGARSPVARDGPGHRQSRRGQGRFA